MIAAVPQFSPVLVFDRADPTGAGGVQGAVLTLGALGCLPLTVVTAVACGDTRGVDMVYALEADWVFEQAQALLEDMHVSAILIGDAGSLSSVGAIAELAADYAAPLVFAPGDLRDAPDPDDSDDLAAASIELLLPQTTVLVIDSTAAHRLVCSGDEDQQFSSALDAARALVDFGAQSVLLADGRDAALQAVDTLVGMKGIVSSRVRPAPQRPIQGALPALAAALAAGLAAGLEIDAAAELASRYLATALDGAVRPGMGAAQPDRLAVLRQAAK